MDSVSALQAALPPSTEDLVFPYSRSFARIASILSSPDDGASLVRLLPPRAPPQEADDSQVGGVSSSYQGKAQKPTGRCRSTFPRRPITMASVSSSP
jgi:hypothetical protein